MLHRAGPNPTDEVRKVMTIMWYADDARSAEPATTYQELDLRTWL